MGLGVPVVESCGKKGADRVRRRKAEATFGGRKRLYSLVASYVATVGHNCSQMHVMYLHAVHNSIIIYFVKLSFF